MTRYWRALRPLRQLQIALLLRSPAVRASWPPTATSWSGARHNVARRCIGVRSVRGILDLVENASAFSLPDFGGRLRIQSADPLNEFQISCGTRPERHSPVTSLATSSQRYSSVRAGASAGRIEFSSFVLDTCSR
jgi:hypothetical protein